MAEFSSYPAGTPCWVDLATTDVAAARAFYAALFGWGYEEPGPETGGYVIATLRGKPVAGLSALTPDQLAQGMPPSWTTYLAVDDVTAATDRSAAAGATVLAGPMQVMDEGSMAVLQDPSGAVVALWQPGRHIGAQLANEPGSFSWNELLTRDLPAARAFYTDVFGYATQELDIGAESPYVVLAVGDHPVGGMMAMPAEVPAEAPAHWLTYFAVADTDASLETLRSAGGQVWDGPRDSPYGRLAVVADPQGATFTVMQQPAEG